MLCCQCCPCFCFFFFFQAEDGIRDLTVTGVQTCALPIWATYHTGDLHTHDVAIAGDDIWLAATRFSCLAKFSYDFSFLPAWKPKFISDLVPEDRCHLNGIAVRDGRPRYVTALGTTDAAAAWREEKATGGVLIDI